MTLRIDTTRLGGRLVVRLIGRIKAEHLADLDERIAHRGARVVLDLDEVTLVDVDVVRFLDSAEREGVGLRNCPPFVREWIRRERGRG